MRGRLLASACELLEHGIVGPGGRLVLHEAVPGGPAPVGLEASRSVHVEGGRRSAAALAASLALRA
eukprot:1580795-Alexandrium_andersonii.AAC.1